MTSYDLSRNFWNWAFENPEKIQPAHAAIYLFAVEHCNRLGWKDKFGFPSQMTMDAVGISKYQTYTKYFNELVEFGFIKMIQKSKNQYSANIISLMCALPKNGKALDKAFIKHGVKHSEGEGVSEGKSNHESEGSIIKQYNQEPLTINQYTNNREFSEFLNQFESEVWYEQLAMNYSITLNKIQELAKTFINDRKNDMSYEEKSLSELRTWFINYIKINKDSATKTETPMERADRLIKMAEAKNQKYKL